MALIAISCGLCDHSGIVSASARLVTCSLCGEQQRLGGREGYVIRGKAARRPPADGPAGDAAAPSMGQADPDGRRDWRWRRPLSDLRTPSAAATGGINLVDVDPAWKDYWVAGKAEPVERAAEDDRAAVLRSFLITRSRDVTISYAAGTGTAIWLAIGV